MESNLIYRITKGDEQAFEAFMDNYSGTLFHYAYSILRDKEASEELVSDVFMEVWNKRKTLFEIEHLSGWLHTVTYRKAVSWLRHQSGKPASVSIDDVENFHVGTIEAPDESLILREEINKLYEAIESLPPKCKHVFYLAKISRIPYKEISGILNISVTTINYHIGFAMDALKKKFRQNKK